MFFVHLIFLLLTTLQCERCVEIKSIDEYDENRGMIKKFLEVISMKTEIHLVMKCGREVRRARKGKKKKKKQCEEANKDTKTLTWVVFLDHTPKFTEPVGFRRHLD